MMPPLRVALAHPYRPSGLASCLEAWWSCIKLNCQLFIPWIKSGETLLALPKTGPNRCFWFGFWFGAVFSSQTKPLNRFGTWTLTLKTGFAKKRNHKPNQNHLVHHCHLYYKRLNYSEMERYPPTPCSAPKVLRYPEYQIWNMATKNSIRQIRTTYVTFLFLIWN